MSNTKLLNTHPWVNRAIKSCVLDCGVPEIEDWAKSWISGEDKTLESAGKARDFHMNIYNSTHPRFRRDSRKEAEWNAIRAAEYVLRDDWYLSVWYASQASAWMAIFKNPNGDLFKLSEDARKKELFRGIKEASKQ